MTYLPIFVLASFISLYFSTCFFLVTNLYQVPTIIKNMHTCLTDGSSLRHQSKVLSDDLASYYTIIFWWLAYILIQVSYTNNTHWLNPTNDSCINFRIQNSNYKVLSFWKHIFLFIKTTYQACHTFENLFIFSRKT